MIFNFLSNFVLYGCGLWKLTPYNQYFRCKYGSSRLIDSLFVAQSRKERDFHVKLKEKGNIFVVINRLHFLLRLFI